MTRRRSETWTLKRISDYFAESSEFEAKYGELTNEEFVERIYTEVLERPADPDGLAYWTRQLDTGAKSRGDVMLGFSDSSEYKRRQFPPGPRITTKAFGKDRRLPITNRYRG